LTGLGETEVSIQQFPIDGTPESWLTGAVAPLLQVLSASIAVL
jgi:hypothetical protein